MKRRLTAASPVLLISISAWLLWSGLTNGQDWGDDFSQYIMQAESIIQGRPAAFIEANRFTIEQSSYTIGPVTYPWGFPVLLAPVYAVFGPNIIALKYVVVVCFLLFLLLLWRGFRRYHTDGWRIFLLGLFAVNPTILQFINGIVADIPFLLMSTLSVLLIGRLAIDRRPLISPVYDQLILGAAIAGAFVMRIHGILLLATLGFTQFVAFVQAISQPDGSSNPRAAGLTRPPHGVRFVVLSILPYVAFVGLLLVWRVLLPDGGVSAQGAELGGVSIETIKQNIHYYIELPGDFFDRLPHSRLIYGASIPFAVAGAIARFRLDYHALVYVALTFLLYILYPPTAGLRFLFPILPFYASFVLSSLQQVAGGMRAPALILKKALCLIPLVVIILYFGKESLLEASANLARHRAVSSGPFADTSRSMFSSIIANTEADSTIVFFKPRAMRMMTGRRSLKTYDVSDLSRADYLCLYQPGTARPGEGIDQVVLPEEVQCMAEKGMIQSVYKNDDFVVYRLIAPHKNALLTDGACAVPRSRPVRRIRPTVVFPTQR